jgi:hypothetical protein
MRDIKIEIINTTEQIGDLVDWLVFRHAPVATLEVKLVAIANSDCRLGFAEEYCGCKVTVIVKSQLIQFLVGIEYFIEHKEIYLGY